MANVRRETVSYQPFRTQPLLADGLLPVARPGGELLDKVSSAFFRLADEAGRRADQETFDRYSRASRQAAVDGAPGASLEGVGETGAEAPPMQASARELAARGKAYLMRKYGVSNEFASGLLGQFSGESNFNVNAINRNDGADGSHSIGIGQWNGARARALKAFAGAQGKPVNDFETQLDFAMHELHTSEGGVGRRLSAARTVEEAVAAGVGYERPQGWSAANPRGALGWNHRLAAARSIAGIGIDSVPSDVGADTGAAPYVAPGLSFTGGTWRPMAGNTLAARAWNDAGSKVYLEELDNEMRSTIGQAFELYKDDPTSLEKTLTSLKAATAKEHVFAEILPEFSVGFDRLATSYLDQARENRQKAVAEQNRADFIGSTAELETRQQRQIAEFDPSTGSAADAIASSQQAIDAHYDDAVRRHVLDPGAAEVAKLKSRREAALGYYGRQADALDADGVASLHGQMREDFADGKLAGVDGDGWAALDKGLTALETKKRMAARRVENDYRKTGDAFAQHIVDGGEVDQAELAKYALAAGQTPEGKTALQETYAKISVARELRDFTLAHASATVAGLKKQYGDGITASQARVLAFAQKTIDAKREAIRTDSVSYAERQGLAPATPLLAEAQSPEELASIVASRVAAAPDVSEHLGVAPRYLKKGEAAAVAKMVRADPEKGAAIAGALVGGAGPAAVQVLQEFGQDAPMIAEAGAIVYSGGSQQAAEDVIAGYGKSADGKKLTGLKPAAAAQGFNDAVGGALTLQPQDRVQISNAAVAIARTRISREGVDPTSDEAMAIHHRAVQEAAGAVFDRGRQFGGFADVDGSKVWVPSTIAADQFGDVLGALTDADLAALKVKPKAGFYGFSFAGGLFGARQARGLASTLQGATPVAVNGGYAFAYGDPAGDDPQYVQGDDGKVFVLDIEALRPQLEGRVPGAWR